MATPRKPTDRKKSAAAATGTRRRATTRQATQPAAAARKAKAATASEAGLTKKTTADDVAASKRATAKSAAVTPAKASIKGADKAPAKSAAAARSKDIIAPAKGAKTVTATKPSPNRAKETPAPQPSAEPTIKAEPPAPSAAATAKASPPKGGKAEHLAAAKAAAAVEPPVYTDMARFAQYMADMNVRTQDILKDVAEKHADLGRRGVTPTPDPLNVAEAGTEVATALSQNPMRLMQMQLGLWEGYSRLFAHTMEKMAGMETRPVAMPRPGDKRFVHKAWEENPLLDFVKQSYLLLSEWVDKAINTAEGVDAATRRRAFFHADQILSALSPSNVPTLNPEVLDETIRTQGTNFLQGMKNFVSDLERGHGELAITQTDLDYFKVGQNIATTPGKVIYQNAIMQLIQYAPTTTHVAERPIVIFPPWINKFYILDLQPDNSFIRWLVDQGRTVFVTSWVNPGPELKDKSFPDYMREGVFEALEAAERATGARSFDTIGYCIGGTLLAVSLAYMAQKGDTRINSATFFTAQTDFTEAGDLLLFVDDRQLENIEKQIDVAGGVLEGSAMARTFNMLRPNDLIWSAFVDNYFKGKEAKKFDLLYWNSDSTRMTKASHLFYLREFYHLNRLGKGELVIDDVSIDLAKITQPIFMQAGEADHIAPYRSVYRSARLFGGKVTYVLAGSGHIAGVINHPDKKKYHYRTNSNLPDTVDEWMAHAQQHPYSWWPHWIEWLNRHSGGKVPARTPGDGALVPIEDAPGSYVMVKCD